MSKKKERELDDYLRELDNYLFAAGKLYEAGLSAKDTQSALLDIRYASYDGGVDESYLDYLNY